ncbi:hypothetical protein ACQYWQ_25140 [Streptomyces sp. P6-2-1]
MNLSAGYVRWRTLLLLLFGCAVVSGVAGTLWLLWRIGRLLL